MPLDAAAVQALSEQTWILEGPDSGGMRTIVYGGGRVFILSFGDAAIEQGDVSECSVETFCERYAADPAVRDAVDWLRSRGTEPAPSPPVVVRADAAALTVIVAPEPGGVAWAQRLHDGPILALDVSADGTRIATGGADGWIRLLDGAGSSSGRVIASAGPGAPVCALVFVGERLVASRGTRTLEIFRAEDLAPAPPIELGSGAARVMGWDGSIMISGDDGALVLASLDGAATRRFDVGAVAACGLARCGEHVAIGTASELVLLDTRTGEIARQSLDRVAGRSLRESAIRTVRAHPDGRRVVVDYTSVEMDLYPTDGLVAVDPTGVQAREHVAIGPYGGTWIALADGLLVLGGHWTTAGTTATPLRVIPTLRFGVTTFALTSRGSQIVTGDSDGMLRVWDLARVVRAAGRPTDDEPAALAREAPAGELVVLRERSRIVQRRGLERGEVLEPLSLPHLVEPRVFALVGGRIGVCASTASAGVSKQLLVLEASGERALFGNDLLSMIEASTVAPGGLLLALVGSVDTGPAGKKSLEGRLLVVDVETRRTVASVAHGFWYARSVLLSRDGAFAVVDELTQTGFVRVTDGRVSIRAHRELPGRAIGYAHPGGWLMVGERLVVLDPDRIEPIASHDLPDGMRGTGAVIDLADTGLWLAIGGATGVRVVDLERGESSVLPPASTSPVTAVMFAPDGDRLAVGHADGTVAVTSVERREILGVHAGVERIASVAMPRSDRVASIDVRGRLALFGVARDR